MAKNTANLTIEQLKKINPASIDIKERIELYYQAAISNNSEELLKQISEWGYDIKEVANDGTSLKTLLTQKIQEGKYPKSKIGDLQKQKDKNTLNMLNHDLKIGKSYYAKKKTVLTIVCSIVVIIAAIILGFVLKEALKEQKLNVENGDRVVIDFTGYMNDEAFDGGAAEDYELVIGSNTFIDDFEDQLVGHNVGETVDVNVTFPEDYLEPSCAGQDAKFVVTIKDIIEE